MVTLLWFGRDLRLADNPALAAALARGGTVVPLFILDDADAGTWAPGGAARWWLHGSLAALDASLRKRGSRLILRHGPAEAVLDRLLQETGADAIYWNRRYEPWAIARGERLKTTLKHRGLDVRSFNAALLREPWTLQTQKGEPYRVFTPFWKGAAGRWRRFAGAAGAGPNSRTLGASRQRDAGRLGAAADCTRLGRRFTRALDARRGRCAGPACRLHRRVRHRL